MKITRQSATYLSYLLFLSILLSACTFSKVRKDLEAQNKIVTVKGSVIDEFNPSSPVVAVLLDVANPTQPVLMNLAEMERPGTFTFQVPPGHYRIFAYENVRGDREYRKVDRVGRSRAIDAMEPGAEFEVEVRIPRKVEALIADQAGKIQSGLRDEDVSNPYRYVGTVTTLDNPAFSPENVKMGLWEPYRFATTVPMGIFFLHEYRPDRIPVLFVHGISGSPANFREIIQGIDTEHYQPWVFYFPSGFRIHLIADYLNDALNYLRFHYRFTHMAIVAHSMGGLVARDFLNTRSVSENAYTINPFISISTPWAGHEAARLGVKYAPAVVPAWNDLAPGSPFLNKLFATLLDKEMTWAMFFSFRGSGGFADGNNDGVVSIASQLRPEAQEEADIMRGYDKTHMGILKDPDVSAMVNRILASTSGEKSHGISRTGKHQQ